MASKTEIHRYRFLSETKVRVLARRYGLHHNDCIVRQNADQADATHGQSSMLNGHRHVSWATDDRGYFDAERLLDGYLQEETRVMRADANSHADFCRDAYGD